MSTELQRIALNRNQAGLGPAPAGGSLGQQIASNQMYYANQGVIPRAMGGPIGMGRTADQWANLNRRALANQDRRYEQVMLNGGQGQTTGGNAGGGGGSAGGGGSGGFRMPPQDPNRRIGTRIGPRTSAEYVAENGGLSPQRTSALDAAYGRGDLRNPNAAPPSGTSVPSNAFDAPPPVNDSFAGGVGMGAGAAVGKALVPMINRDDSGPKAAEISQSPEGRWLMNKQGDDFIKIPKPGEIPYEDMWTTPVNDFATGAFSEALTALPGKTPTMRAKGGHMKIGQKPYLVGEEGPELILPRENGDGFVLPADVTAQVLPAMRQVTPRAEGGVMYLDDGGMVARGFDYGPGMRGHSTSVPTDVTANAAGPRPDTIMLDPSGRYQVDPTQPGMPLMPDNVTGPWAQPGLPAPDMTAQNAMITKRVDAMPGRGAMAASRYPGMTFNDTAVQSMVDYGDAMPGNSVADYQAKERQYNQAGRDPFINSSTPNLSFEEMQQRIAMRGMMYGDDNRDRWARDQTQADLAARAARAPLGTPTAPVSQIPGMPGMPAMRPSAAADMQRRQERFLRTPQGTVFALQQQQEFAKSGQKVQERMALIQPVALGNGDYVVPLTGQYIKRDGSTRQVSPEEAKQFGLVPDGINKDGQMTYGRPEAATSRGFQLIPGTYDMAGNLTPDRVFDPYTGAEWNQGEPPPPEVTAARSAAGSSQSTASNGTAARQPYNPFQ